MLKISIITVCYNSAATIAETIQSIVSQGYANTEYIVVDGGSTDGTVEIIKNADVVTKFISEPDNGMYDALVKGFNLASGDIVCYLNAGDFLYPHAFELVASVFTHHDIDWLTGYRSVCNENNVITHVDIPFRYKSSLIKTGSYGRALPYIQQESTFWRKSLLDTVDLNYLRQLKLAGDYYLWWSFSKKYRLDIISSPLGVFKKHTGQLSENISLYNNEVTSFIDNKTIFHRVMEMFEISLWALHPKLRAIFFKTILEFDHKKNVWKKG